MSYTDKNREELIEMIEAMQQEIREFKKNPDAMSKAIAEVVAEQEGVVPVSDAEKLQIVDAQLTEALGRVESLRQVRENDREVVKELQQKAKDADRVAYEAKLEVSLLQSKLEDTTRLHHTELNAVARQMDDKVRERDNTISRLANQNVSLQDENEYLKEKLGAKGPLAAMWETFRFDNTPMGWLFRVTMFLILAMIVYGVTLIL